MIENSDFRIEEADLSCKFDVKLIKDFMSPLGFDFDEKTVEYSAMLYNLNDDIVGVGSYHGKILKYLAVAPHFRESGAFAFMVTHLTEKVMVNHQQAFVFTRPENIVRFESLGYNHIASADPMISVLEFGYKNINNYKNYLHKVKSHKQETEIAAIVMNCNPFTLGHQYLIERASSENQLVYVFVVESERSAFSFKDRIEMIRQGIAHLKNVVLVKGDEYVVSCATFPNYFLKNEMVDTITKKQAELDINIFAQHLAPVLGIKKRYVGTENYCATTKVYNEVMKEILPEYNIELIEVQRREIEDNEKEYISASKVRKAIKNRNTEVLYDLLPKSTLGYINNHGLIDKVEQVLQKSDTRH